MLIRALIVLLVVLNVGVAAWWLGRAPAAAPPSPPQPLGVALLEVVPMDKPAAAASVSPASAAPVAAAPAVLPDAAVCFRVGPFAERGSAERSATPLGTRALRARVRELPAAGAAGYSVLLPPQADRAAAQALAQRVGAAGISDYLVINDGADANGVALGRFRGRDSALRRLDQLLAAGFPAEVRATGRAVSTQWWLELATPPATQAEDLAPTFGSLTLAPQDCAALR